MEQVISSQFQDNSSYYIGANISSLNKYWLWRHIDNIILHLHFVYLCNPARDSVGRVPEVTSRCIPRAEKSSGILQKTLFRTNRSKSLQSIRQHCWAHERCSLGPRAPTWRPSGETGDETLHKRTVPPQKILCQRRLSRMSGWSVS